MKASQIHVGITCSCTLVSDKKQNVFRVIVIVRILTLS